MESLESINNLFPWSTKYQRRNINSGKIGTKSYESKLLYIILKRRKKGIQLYSISFVINKLIFIISKISFRNFALRFETIQINGFYKCKNPSHSCRSVGQIIYQNSFSCKNIVLTNAIFRKIPNFGLCHL